MGDLILPRTWERPSEDHFQLSLNANPQQNHEPLGFPVVPGLKNS